METNPNVLPDWVRKNPGKLLPRLQYEARALHEKFPNLGFYRKNDTLYIEGSVVSISLNAYRIRIIYGPNYPFEPPEGYVVDKDVVDFCSLPGNSGHNYHNYGKKDWGLKLCLLNPNDWQMLKSGISIVDYVIAWINAYELKRVRGYWALPE